MVLVGNLVYNSVVGGMVGEGKVPKGFMDRFLIGSKLSRESLLEICFSKIVVKEGGCWVWQDAPSNKGYGRLAYGSKSLGTYRLVLAHRLVYELVVGGLVKGEPLFIKCGNRMCVNPEHMEKRFESGIARYDESPEVVVSIPGAGSVRYILKFVSEDKHFFYYESGLYSEIEASVSVRRKRRYKCK